MKYQFQDGFVWGTATASYQIEGAVLKDGRGESIWDRFCQMPGNILLGDTGDEANDHYHRYQQDVALMKELGHKAYRFSVSWSRVMPDGRGAVNEKGLQFYESLVDALLAAGIEPYLTIYHWDLPQALQDIGGWQNEDMIGYFEAYCRLLFTRLGGKVKKWITLNEPYCTAFAGNLTGEHAPGIRDLGTAIRVSYILLRAHGAAVRLFRSMHLPGEIGITLNAMPVYAVSDSPEDQLAVKRQDGMNNRWFFDPVLKGAFPADMIELFQSLGITLPDFREQASICESLDFLGVNYYFTTPVRFNRLAWPLQAETVPLDLPRTDRDWPIDPDGLTKLLVHLKNEYNADIIYLTENGASYNDTIDPDGEIHDDKRIDYLRRHFIAAHNAIAAGVNLRGYFVWSLYDNFEWAFGRYSRFGIVYEDFATHKRTPKQSAYWFRDVIRQNGLD